VPGWSAVAFECGQQRGELPEALDAAELGLGGEHPGSGPAQRHLAVLPALHPPGVVADDLDHGLGRVGRLHGLEQRAAHAEPVDRERVGEPLA
jgi:hypothetical protein